MIETTKLIVIPVKAVYGLRHSVLRPNGTIEDCKFPGDIDDTTVQFGAYRDEELVGIASLYCERLPEEDDQVGWRIRGMATELSVRGQGFGQLLVENCIATAKENGADVLWCNARSSAVGFYQKLVFESIGDEFEIPTIGPHYLMTLCF